VSVTALALLLALADSGPAASPAPAPPARQPAQRSFTDDDLDRYRQEREGARPAAKATPVPGTPATPVSGDAGDEAGSGGEASAARFQELHADLAAAEAARDATRARIARTQSLLNPMSAEFEVDPNAILRLQAELREARAQLEEHEAAVESARAALEAFEDEARRAGVRLPPRD
jgi:hypothetical protein